MSGVDPYAEFVRGLIEYSLQPRVEVHHRGRIYRPLEADHQWPDPEPMGLRIWQREALDEGEIRENGQVLEGRKRQRLVDRLSGAFDKQPAVFDPTAPEWAVRPYIPGLMNHGTVPALVGPKNWGKTKFLCGFETALVVPGHRLFGHFDPVEVTEEERARDVWLLNAETHPGVLHAELLANGLSFGYRDRVPCYFHDADGRGEPDPSQGVLVVEHLAVTSATEFDLTDEARYDYWATRLTEFVKHRIPPLTVVADGVTAMLGNNTSRYGIWTSRFKDLLRECGIPNGLGVLHSPMGVNTNTPMNGIESMGQWDGMWLASSPAFPIRPSDRRYIETIPRLGDPVLSTCEIVVDDDGTLRLLVDSKPARPSEAGTSENAPDRKGALLARLEEAHSDGLWTKEVCGSGDEYKPDRAALDELLSEGRVSSEMAQQGRSRGLRWRISRSV